MRRIAVAILLVFSLVCCFTLPMSAQEGSATLTGFIQDSSKAVIPGVKVTAIDTNTNQHFEATTGKDGGYTIVSLPVGPYQMQIEKPGFKTVLKDDLFLHTQDALQVNFQMAVGSTSETVTVNGASTNDSPAVSMVVTREFVENMPLNGESFQDLLALAPGAVSSANNAGYYSINGQRDDANNFMVDGVSANAGVGLTGDGNPQSSQFAAGGYPSQTAIGTTQALLSVDALQEFRIQTSGYTAEYGRQPGGQIEITSRSGTDSFHGTVVDRLRNTVMDANNWFANNTRVPRGAEHQNDFGGTFGGPVIIPHLYDGKKKTFFFVSYEGLRLLLPQFITDEPLPTAAFRQIAAPGVQPYLNALPLPNGPPNSDGVTAQFSASFDNANSLDATSVRFDQALGSNFHFFLRYADNPSVTAGQYPPFANSRHETIDTSSWTLGGTWSINPLLTDEARFNYTAAYGRTHDIPTAFHGAQPLSIGEIVPSQYTNLLGGYWGEIDLTPSDAALFTEDQYFNYPNQQQQYEILNSLSWTHGKHTVKFGGDFRHLVPVLAAGQYVSYIDIASVASLLQGNADLMEIGTVIPGKVTFENLSLYAQDNWKLNSTLALDFGLRWEFNPPPGPDNGSYPPALTTSNLSVTQLAPAGTPLYHDVFHNFAPRLGFSWRALASQSHPIVLRGGIGIFYDTGQLLGANAYNFSSPFQNFNVLSNVPLPSSMANFIPPPAGEPLTPPYPELTGLVDPNLKLPYTQQWNLSLDFGLNSKDTMTVSYVGNEGKDLLFQATYNNGLANNPLFPDNFYQIATNAASSSYNALQVQDQGYLTSSVQLIASYTWAHAIDDSSSDQNSYPGSAPERGNSNNDIRQAINLAVTYQASGLGFDRLSRSLTRGWLFSNRFTAESGYPLLITQGHYTPAGGSAINITPDLVPSVQVYLHDVPKVPGGWQLNRAAFSLVPLNSNGVPTQNSTLGRNSIFGPPFWTLNTALQRSIPVRDRFFLEVRVDAFNIFNHPAFSGVDTNLRTSTFGETSTQATIGVDNPLYASGAPRSLQASLKLRF